MTGLWLAALALLGALLAAAPARAQLLTWIETEVDDPPTVDGLSFAIDLDVSPDGKHVYIASSGDSAVGIFARDEASGALDYVGLVTEGFVIGGPSDVVVSPDGKHVYAVGQSDDAVTIVVVFARDAMTGGLMWVETQKDGVGGVAGLRSPTSLALSPDGAHLYVACYASLVAFSRDADTGALTFLGYAEYGHESDPGVARAVVVSPDGRHVYVAGETSNFKPPRALSMVTAFRRESNGLLTFVEAEVDNESGVDGLASPFDVAIAPDGAHVYVPGSLDSGIAVFARDDVTGVLDFRQVVKDGNSGVDGLAGAFGLALSPDGTRLYVAGARDDALVVFDRDPVCGILNFRDLQRDGVVAGGEGLDGPRSVKVSPDGRHVYSSQPSANSLAAFRLTSAIATTTSTTPTSSTTTTSGAVTPTTSTSLPRCRASPLPGCRKAARTSLLLRDRRVDRRDRLVWKWSKGAATTLADLGDPRAGTGYRLCIYFRPGGTPVDVLVLDALAPAGAACGGKPCWTSTKKGFRYFDRRATSEGLLRLRLKAGGASKAAAGVVGHGVELTLPRLPLVPPVTVQLHAGTGACWDADYATLERNTSSLLRGSTD